MGSLISSIVFILVTMGVPEDLASTGISGLWAFVSLLVWVIGQFARKDLTWGIFRK